VKAIWVKFLVEGKKLSLLLSIQISTGIHSASYSVHSEETSLPPR